MFRKFIFIFQWGLFFFCVPKLYENSKRKDPEISLDLIHSLNQDEKCFSSLVVDYSNVLLNSEQLYKMTMGHYIEKKSKFC